MKGVLERLVGASTPFLRIDGVKPCRWKREMQDPKDGRIGPWEYEAQFTVLDAKTWATQGEVLYFVRDRSGKLRLVGESGTKLKGRWKEVPMSDVDTGRALGRRALFHSTAWPSIEQRLQVERGPFVVSALFRPELEAQCRSIGGPLQLALEKPEGRKKLSYHVETWIRMTFRGPLDLWNRN